MKVKTNENQRVSDLSKKRQRIENIQMRMKMKVKTNKNQRVSDLSKKCQRNEKNPNADEIKTKNKGNFVFVTERHQWNGN